MPVPTNICDIPFLRVRDIPCGCAPPPLQCCVDDFASLPTDFHISPPAPPNTPLEDGDIYVTKDNLIPFFWFFGAWHPLASPGDADWFVEGVGGPTYGVGLNTDNAFHDGPIAINRTSIRGSSGVLDVEGQILAVGVFTGVSDVPVDSTDGAAVEKRMMWLPETASFRAGSVDGTQWDDVNIGETSAAFGARNIASGINAFVANKDNTASGRFCTVFGADNTAMGDQAFIGGGQNNTSSGDDTHIMGGAFNTASADKAIVGGSDSVSGGLTTFVHGTFVEANGDRTALFGQVNLGPLEVYTQDDSFITHDLRPFLHAPSSAPVDGDIHTNQVSFWLDEGSNLLVFRVRYSVGTFKTGTVSLI